MAEINNKPTSINFLNLVLSNPLTRPSDKGFTKTAKNVLEKIGISMTYYYKIIGLVLFFVSFVMYNIIIYVNMSSAMVQYIAFSSYLWISMLGIILLFC